LQDLNFPIFEYKKGQSLKESGRQHGEEFRESIHELAKIRRELMLKKNPALAKDIPELAKQQWNINEKYMPILNKELEGMCDGANISKEDIVILNNYTDFRDITLPDEGCSTIYYNQNGTSYSGQTWDMHGSAQNFLCLLKINPSKEYPEQEMLVFTLVGCLALMGINNDGVLVGVNNINTTDAKPGIIWPALVRETLNGRTQEEAKKILYSLPVTSGHNYILSDAQSGGHYEITPTIQDVIGEASDDSPGIVYHTNHCLGERVKQIENKESMSSTTHAREELLKKLVPNVKTFDDFVGVFKSHEGYPKSICSHYETGALDPSFTCGAGAMDYQTNDIIFWRGCAEHTGNYVEHRYNLKEKTFKRLS
jgi:isopenicillin-N N-acyltransferase-like protein